MGQLQHSNKKMTIAQQMPGRGGDVVVQFHPWFNLYFPLFLSVAMHDHDYKTKEIKN